VRRGNSWNSIACCLLDCTCTVNTNISTISCYAMLCYAMLCYAMLCYQFSGISPCSGMAAQSSIWTIYRYMHNAHIHLPTDGSWATQIGSSRIANNVPQPCDDVLRKSLIQLHERDVLSNTCYWTPTTFNEDLHWLFWIPVVAVLCIINHHGNTGCKWRPVWRIIANTLTSPH
jgi:hypothetical protein